MNNCIYKNHTNGNLKWVNINHGNIQQYYILVREDLTLHGNPISSVILYLNVHFVRVLGTCRASVSFQNLHTSLLFFRLYGFLNARPLKVSLLARLIFIHPSYDIVDNTKDFVNKNFKFVKANTISLTYTEFKIYLTYFLLKR